MRNEIIIFRGPSISGYEAKNILSNAIYLPPAMQGDMYRAYREYRPKAMGLIDGNFERIPSPWHKEILYLMSQGVKIFGASSMGALRAAELDVYGMIGIGQIYQQYAQNIVEDDDEVGILHAPKELDYKPISDAMVDIRLSLIKARRENIISESLKGKLETFYKNRYYKDRSYDAGIAHFKNLNSDEIVEFENWLPFNKVEQKKADAILLLEEIQNHEGYRNPDFQFENTVYWHNLKFMIDKVLKTDVA
jgi:hypothetical protein